MVTFKFETNLHKIIDSITSPIAKGIDVKWLTEDITVVCPNSLGATLIYDFNFSVATILEVTHDGTTFAPIESNTAITGKQSRYLRVLNGDKINFRAKTGGTLSRLVVGEV